MAALSATPLRANVFGRAALPARPARGVRAQRVAALAKQNAAQVRGEAGHQGIVARCSPRIGCTLPPHGGRAPRDTQSRWAGQGRRRRQGRAMPSWLAPASRPAAPGSQHHPPRRARTLQDAVFKATAAASLTATLLAAGNAQAATEVASLAAGDNRVGLLATLALPAAGWVLFNILGPLKNQPRARAGRRMHDHRPPWLAAGHCG